MGDDGATFAVALAFAAIHLFGRRFVFLQSQPRSLWLSAAGGVSVAYVFVHLLPELAAQNHALREKDWVFGFDERHLYAAALLGLIIFYGLERMAARSRHAGAQEANRGAFALHLFSFALYNVVIGILLVRRQTEGALEEAAFAFAMGVHFLVTDHALRAHHQALYDRRGRWIVAGAPLLGWALGMAHAVPEATIAYMFALLAGGVVLNVLKEELPEERESRFSAFALSAFGYAALLLIAEG